MLQPGQVKMYQRGVLDSRGPFYIKLIGVNTNTNTAVIEVGRLFGNTLANIGGNARWNEKAFIVQEVFYNVVGIKAKNDTLKYIVFREKVPKFAQKIYGKHILPWPMKTDLPEMPPFNIDHAIMLDVLSTQNIPMNQTDKIGEKFVTRPLSIQWTEEAKEKRFKGELKEIYAENMTDTPGPGPQPNPTCTGDINGDNKVNFDDFAIFAAAYGTQTGNPNFNAKADLNNDGKVNFDDFAIFASKYGTSC